MKDCVLDTDVVIGALDRQDAHHRQARSALVKMLGDTVGLYVSSINYAEALVKPAENAESLERAVGAIATLGIAIHAPDAATARDAAHLRRFNISLADGFALATARQLNASIASFDARVLAAARKIGVTLKQGMK